MGRTPRPTAKKILEGEPNKNRINQNEPKPDNTMPSCPKWLPKDAKRIWRREARKLHNAGLLTFVDGPAYANYCLLRAQLKQAYEELGDALTYEYTNKNGSTNEVARPQVAIIHKCLEQLKGYSGEFGMTPVSRSRINATPQTKEEDPMEEILKHPPCRN